MPASTVERIPIKMLPVNQHTTQTAAGARISAYFKRFQTKASIWIATRTSKVISKNAARARRICSNIV